MKEVPFLIFTSKSKSELPRCFITRSFDKNPNTALTREPFAGARGSLIAMRKEVFQMHLELFIVT